MRDPTAIARKIRLRQLRCFVTVARRKSFILAAEELGLTQPAVSRSVRELEQIFDHRLFDRSTRGAELTSRGRALLEAAEASLLQILQGTNAVVGQLGRTETVKIGALPNVCSQFLPAIVHSFKSDHPSVKVRILPGTNADLLDSLRRGETDFVIGRLSTSKDMKGLIFEALFDEPLVFVVRQDHPLIKKRPTAREAAKYPMLLPPEGTIIRQEVNRFLSAQGLTQPADIVETTSSDFQRAYLAITDAVAVIPRGVVQPDLEQNDFVQLDIGSEEMRGPVGLTMNPELSQGAAARQILERIRNQH
ncbi:MAG: LysR substrate-binding domain-containing protein [Pseudomonadota bacterium]